MDYTTQRVSNDQIASIAYHGITNPTKSFEQIQRDINKAHRHIAAIENAEPGTYSIDEEKQLLKYYKNSLKQLRKLAQPYLQNMADTARAINIEVKHPEFV